MVVVRKIVLNLVYPRLFCRYIDTVSIKLFFLLIIFNPLTRACNENRMHIIGEILSKPLNDFNKTENSAIALSNILSLKINRTLRIDLLQFIILEKCSLEFYTNQIIWKKCISINVSEYYYSRYYKNSILNIACRYFQ